LAIFISKISLVFPENRRVLRGRESQLRSVNIWRGKEGRVYHSYPKEIDGTATYESKIPRSFLKEEVSSCGERWLNFFFARVTYSIKKKDLRRDWDLDLGWAWAIG
jgi:hypothetical protein